MKSFAAVAFSALLLASCGDVHTPGEDVVAPSPPVVTPGVPVRLVLNAGSRPDQQLDVSAQLLDGRGAGVPSVDVAFSITGGSVTPSTVKTDASGVAKAIALTSGQQTLSATSGTLTQTSTVIGGATALSVTLFVGPVVVGSASTLSASVTGQPIGGPFAYVWTYGDGVTESGSSSSVTHTYAKSDRYNATVKVTDGVGRSATGAASAVVNDPPAPAPPPPPAPAPTLSATMNCAAGTLAHSQACNIAATFGSTQIASNKISVSWDWGDGQVDPLAASPNGTRTYANAGTYLVIAHVTADATAAGGPVNATATASMSVKVN